MKKKKEKYIKPFSLRIPMDLRDVLDVRVDKSNRSLNGEIVYILETVLKVKTK